MKEGQTNERWDENLLIFCFSHSTGMCDRDLILSPYERAKRAVRANERSERADLVTKTAVLLYKIV